MTDKEKIINLKAEISKLKDILAETEKKLEKSKKLGLVDDLTGCYNQNYYNK